MQKPLKIALIVTVIIFVVAVIGGGYYLKTTRTSENTQNNQNSSQTNNNSNSLPNENDNTNAINTTPQPSPSETPQVVKNEEDAVLRLARVFTERYGSYSNRSNFENIIHLEPFMTESFQKESLQFIEDHAQDGMAEEFYGISTTAASLTVDQFTKEQSATVNIATRRVESRSNQDRRIFSQDAIVELLFVSGNWKINGFT